MIGPLGFAASLSPAGASALGAALPWATAEGSAPSPVSGDAFMSAKAQSGRRIFTNLILLRPVEVRHPELIPIRERGGLERLAGLFAAIFARASLRCSA